MVPGKLPIEELQKLLTGVADHGQQHLAEVEADLMQTSFLLSEAIEKLGASFMAIHEAVSQQQQALETMAQNQLDGDTLRVYRDKIATEVNSAVTGLQFQDLTSQLITRTVKRIEGFKQLLHAIALHGSSMEQDHEHDEIMRLLQEMTHNLNSQSVALAGGLRKSVEQNHMSSGDIELF